MNEENVKIAQALEYLSTHYPEPRLNSNKYVGSTASKPEVISGISYVRTGMKQSKFSHVIYDSCSFENVALTGSDFRSVTFRNTLFTGNSFACCDFYNAEIDGNRCGPFVANNFSLSNFEHCRFSNIRLVNSGMLSSLFHNCTFDGMTIQSSTLEGTSFINCHMASCDISSVNIEYSHFSRTVLEDVLFPFYQFPYVIGAADYMTAAESGISLRAGDKTLSMAEYREQISRLILYFEDKRQYFPMCNLCIAQNYKQGAKRYLLDGISTALEHCDFRLIRYFCQLALHHNILDEFTRQRILQSMDDFLQSEDIPEAQLNSYMTYVGNIRTLLQSGGARSIALHYNIKTNVSRDDPSGVQYVNDLLTELNQSLSQSELKTGFQVSVANYSPYEIAVTILSAVGSAASIASLIWMTIDAVREHHVKKRMLPVDVETYRNFVDAKVDCLRSDLLRLQKEYSQRTFSKYIKEVTQQLKTDLEELYSKDILIFKVKNNQSPKHFDVD